jgi:DNA-binding NtrC family response regulator
MRASVSVQRQQQQPRSLAEVEADYLQETLNTTGGNKTAAARILGISRKNLYERLERLEKENAKADPKRNGDEGSV